MIDHLYDKILEGLEKLSDGDRFEACANSILRKKYARLTPVKGGKDSGFDGVGILPNGLKIQLITTTQEDVIGNVTHSLAHSKEDGQHSDIVSGILQKETPRLMNGRGRVGTALWFPGWTNRNRRR